MDQTHQQVENTLMQSLQAWNKYMNFLHDARHAVNPADSQALQWLAAKWRTEYECLRAVYWMSIRP